MRQISRQFCRKNIIQCMNFTGKSNKDEDYYMRKKGYRNPLKKKISHEFENDLMVDCTNPFSQQLSPWNGSSKLEASISLHKPSLESTLLSKNKAAQKFQPSVEHIVSQHSIDYPGLPIQYSRQPRQAGTRYTCPKLKINSQSVVVSRNQMDEVKRLLFRKKSLNENKKTQKIANLTMQWDEDIIYNPEKKYFEEQNLKRKIIRQFSQTRNQSRHQNQRRDLKGEEKVFKLEFKNNRIHRKQVSIYEFKRHQKSLSPKKTHTKIQNDKQLSPLFSTFDSKEPRQIHGQVKVSNLNFDQIQLKANSPKNQAQIPPERIKSSNCDKWKFRSSLKVKQDVSPAKIKSKNMAKIEFCDKSKLRKEEINQCGQDQALNRITMQLNQSTAEHCAPFKIMARTSPNFFKKTIE